MTDDELERLQALLRAKPTGGWLSAADTEALRHALASLRFHMRVLRSVQDLPEKWNGKPGPVFGNAAEEMCQRGKRECAKDLVRTLADTGGGK